MKNFTFAGGIIAVALAFAPAGHADIDLINPAAFTTDVDPAAFTPEPFMAQLNDWLAANWIDTPLGQLIDAPINAFAAQATGGLVLIGNGADGTESHPDGFSGGLLFGNGGDGWDSTIAGVDGGNGGQGGLFFGHGGDGGDGGTGADGGNGGYGGLLFGSGGNGGSGVNDGMVGLAGVFGVEGTIGTPWHDTYSGPYPDYSLYSTPQHHTGDFVINDPGSPQDGRLHQYVEPPSYTVNTAPVLTNGFPPVDYGSDTPTDYSLYGGH